MHLACCAPHRLSLSLSDCVPIRGSAVLDLNRRPSTRPSGHEAVACHLMDAMNTAAARPVIRQFQQTRPSLADCRCSATAHLVNLSYWSRARTVMSMWCQCAAYDRDLTLAQHRPRLCRLLDPRLSITLVVGPSTCCRQHPPSVCCGLRTSRPTEIPEPVTDHDALQPASLPMRACPALVTHRLSGIPALAPPSRRLGLSCQSIAPHLTWTRTSRLRPPRLCNGLFLVSPAHTARPALATVD